MQHTSNYRFSSALCDLDEETGTFDEQVFKQLVLPIRGRIMARDGLSGCHIARYGVEVLYFQDIVGSEELDPFLEEMFNVARQDNPALFPYVSDDEHVRVIRTTGFVEKTPRSSSWCRLSSSAPACREARSHTSPQGPSQKFMRRPHCGLLHIHS
jgi:hypothetical protein